MNRIPPTGLLQTAFIFGSAGLLLLICTRILIPYLCATTGIEPVAAWFLAGGFGTFLPLVMLGVVLLRRERRLGNGLLAARLRVRALSRQDWVWAVAGIVVIAALSVALQVMLGALTGRSDLQPGFMALEPLGPGRYWILVAWIPFWVINIFGEEFLWRGVILPRQEVVFGGRAWLVNGLGWLIFHAAFGLHLLVLLVPTVFVLPYVVQQRRNTTIGAVIHAAINGPGFIAVAFGLV